MENKIYLEEFLDKLTRMLETSTTDEQIQSCINYVNNYKLQVVEMIENELFEEATLNFLDELVRQIKNESTSKIYESEEEEISG